MKLHNDQDGRHIGKRTPYGIVKFYPMGGGYWAIVHEDVTVEVWITKENVRDWVKRNIFKNAN